MSELCMCGSVDVRIRSEKDADGFGDFIWAECRGCGLRSQNKFVSERCPQSNQECLDDFNEIIKPFKSAQQRINELEVQLKEREWISVEDAMPPIGQECLFFRPLAENSGDKPVAVKVARRDQGQCWESTVPHGFAPCNPSDGYCHVTHWMPLPQPPKDE